MRCQIQWLFSFGFMVLGCTGGQTGDPGVADHTSIVKGGAGTSRGSRVLVPQTEAIGNDGTLTVGDTQVLVLDAVRVAVLDPRLGLRLIDVSDESAPRVIAQLQLPGSQALGMQQLAGGRLIVMQRYPAYAGSRPALNAEYGTTVVPLGNSSLGAEDIENGANSVVTLIDLSDPTAPTQLDSLHVTGEILASEVVEQDGRTLMFCVTNAPPESGSGLKTTHVVSLAVSARALAQLDELSLATDPFFCVTALRFVGPRLIAARENGQASLVELADDGSVREGNLVPAPRYPHAGALSLVGDTLRIGGLALDSFGSSGPLTISVYTIEGVSTVHAAASCDVGQYALTSDVSSVEFLGERAWVQSPTSNVAEALLVDSDAEGGCSKQPVSVPGPGRAVAAGDSALSISLEGRALQVALYALGGASAAKERSHARAEAPGPGAFQVRRVSVLETATAVRAADGSEEHAWLAVPFIGADEQHVVQLFSFSDHTLTARASLSGVGTLSVAAGAFATLSQTELTVFDAVTGKATGKLELNAFYSGMLESDDFIARKRVSPAPLAPDSLTRERSARWELFARTDDPQPGAALGNIEVDPNAQLFGHEHWLIALATTNSIPVRLTGEVFDLSDVTQPRRVGVVDAELPGVAQCGVCAELMDPNGCNCWGSVKFEGLKLAGGLILARRGSGSINLQRQPPIAAFAVIDLRDPSQPQTSQIIPTGDEIIDDAFVQGSSLYYSYYIPLDVRRESVADAGASVDAGWRHNPVSVEPVDAGSEDPFNRAFYAVRHGYRRVDLSDLRQPIVGPRVESPGQLRAIDAQGALYLTDETLDAGKRSVFLRKLDPKNAQHELNPGVELGDVGVAKVLPDARGNLVVEVMGPNWDRDIWIEDAYVLWKPGTTLLSFDKALKRLGGIEVDPYCELRAFADERAILQGALAGHGVYVVDFHDLSAPALQAYYALDTSDESALLFDGQRIRVEAEYGLRTFDATARHL